MLLLCIACADVLREIDRFTQKRADYPDLRVAAVVPPSQGL
jgi:hypothetical protein